jgi:hypothetical protein
MTATIVKMLMSLPGAVGERCRERYIPGQVSFWSALDPVAAAQFLDDHPSQLREIGKTALLSNWAAIDPAAAEAWLGQHPDLAASADVLQDFVWGVYQNNRDTALQYVNSNAGDERFDQILAAVATRTFFSSPDTAETFISSLPNSEARGRAIRGIANLNMELLATAEREGPREFNTVADWILKFPAEDRTGSLSNLFASWRSEDPRPALEWMSKVTPEKQQQVIEEYAETLDSESLQRTFAAADVQLRSRILTALIAKRAATSAERDELVNQLGLAPEDADALERIAGEHP